MKKIIFVVLMFLSPSVFADSILLGAITIHGFPTDEEVSGKMPRRIDSGGQVVFTPGIGYEKTHGRVSVLGSFLKDCYDNYALTLLVGTKISTSNFVDWSFYGGIYGRETPVYFTPSGRKIARDFPWPMALGDKYQIFPMVFLQAEFLPGQKIKPVILTNWGLTEIGLKIEF